MYLKHIGTSCQGSHGERHLCLQDIRKFRYQSLDHSLNAFRSVLINMTKHDEQKFQTVIRLTSKIRKDNRSHSVNCKLRFRLNTRVFNNVKGNYSLYSVF